ncbi:hypothetical protein AVEN_197171-1 [Araneus ventricosus]|uniref:Tc1-like transposase DDE domain-containing protein n=1 Tax=Araneus ventricosus TaxID=182803 RepID=A0A4Y2I9R7_ARAVE|nr:hypothetical protein AVEN_197171-1 [Araneus ventricosus]
MSHLSGSFRIITGDEYECKTLPQIPSPPQWSGNTQAHPQQRIPSVALRREETMNVPGYWDTLTKLMSSIQRKRPGLLSRGILFLDDNARSNTARDAKEDIRRLGWERWDDPAYSPVLSPSDFELFPASK